MSAQTRPQQVALPDNIAEAVLTAAQNATPPAPEASATVTAQTPPVSGDATVAATMPDPDEAVAAAADTASETADAAVDAAPTASASASASTQVATNTELPDEVENAISDGRYTTEDLNRAQLAALQ